MSEQRIATGPVERENARRLDSLTGAGAGEMIGPPLIPVRGGRMSFKQVRRVAVVLGSVAALAVALTPARASAAAIVVTPGELLCVFNPGDVPGVDVQYPGTCSSVETPSGNTLIVARAELPAGYTLSETFVGSVYCNAVVGRIVATTSGQVTAICPFVP
jgi:hypothetical protein